MKKLYIEPRTKIKEQVELLAKMEGLTPGSIKFQERVHKLIDERIKYSAIPHMNNPRTPKLNEKLWNEFDFINDSSIFKNKLDQETFKSAVTSLTNLYVKNALNLKTKSKATNYGAGDVSDFEWPKVKDMSDSAKKDIAIQILQNRYTRLLVATMIIESLIPVFKIKENEVEKFLKTAFGETINDLKMLMDKKNYAIFTKGVQQNVKKVIKQKSLVEEMFSS